MTSLPLIGLIGLLFAGCSAAPTEQLKAFSSSLTAVQTAGKPILADLALAESRDKAVANAECSGKMLRNPSGDPVRDDFCMAEVGLTNNVADPPDTAKFRAGLDALQLYTDTLTVLAAGGSGDTSAQLQTIAGKLQGLASLAGLAGPAGLPIGPAIAALGDLVNQAAAQLSKDEARRLILSGADKVSEIIGKERDAARSIWQKITKDWRRKLDVINRADTQGANDLASKIETYRTVMSNYVVMLDRLQLAWDKTVAATKNPQPATLADLATLSGQLNSDAEAISKAYAILRAGPAK